jgi:hypothetical protein
VEVLEEAVAEALGVVLPLVRVENVYVLIVIIMRFTKEESPVITKNVQNVEHRLQGLVDI